MARHYHVDIARFAAHADAKWVDNLLSHFDIHGVEGARQGLARRITVQGIYQIALIRSLTRDVGMGRANAVALAERLLTTNVVHAPIVAGLEVRLDREAFQRDVDKAIAVAVESVTPARRGRPPRRAEH